MGLLRYFSRRRAGGEGKTLYAAAVRGARRPEFYALCGVPDTLDGRFELVALHAFIVLRRLKRRSGRTAQEFCDAIFADMDDNLREMGAGDLGVGRRVRTMAKAFYGRVAAYEGGLSAGEAALCEALARNVYGTVRAEPEDVGALAAYVRREAERAAPEAGPGFFGPPPDPAGGARLRGRRGDG